jgi:hypothetical protein
MGEFGSKAAAYVPLHNGFRYLFPSIRKLPFMGGYLIQLLSMICLVLACRTVGCNCPETVLLGHFNRGWYGSLYIGDHSVGDSGTTPEDYIEGARQVSVASSWRDFD